MGDNNRTHCTEFSIPLQTKFKRGYRNTMYLLGIRDMVIIMSFQMVQQIGCLYISSLTYLLHVSRVMELEKENKMNAHSLAIVFGPTLIWPEPTTSAMNLATSMVYQSQIVEFMLLEYANVFR